MTKPQVVLVVGARDPLGSAIARLFGKNGFTVCVARRPDESLWRLKREIEKHGGQAHVYGIDARKENRVVALFGQIEDEVGPIDVVVFNIGCWYHESILTLDSRKYFKVWEMAAFAGFLTGREAARRMVERGQGTIIFTGAAASVRGASGLAAFAGAQHALRALAQSMAHELNPKGIHVAHVVIDGPTDTNSTREGFSQIDAKPLSSGALVPEDIAQNCLMLHRQPRSAWTYELNLRSW